MKPSLHTASPMYVAAQAAELMREMLARGFTTVRDNAGADWGLAQAQADARRFGRPVHAAHHRTGREPQPKSATAFASGSSLASACAMYRLMASCSAAMSSRIVRPGCVVDRTASTAWICSLLPFRKRQFDLHSKQFPLRGVKRSNWLPGASKPSTAASR